MKLRPIISAIVIGIHCFPIPFLQRIEAADPMRIEIDATELPRRMISSIVTIPIGEEEQASGGTVALWYAKWVPGSHAPGGPIANLAGLSFQDDQGHLLEWQRSPEDVYRFLVTVPVGTKDLQAHLRYITNQPTTNSHGLDSFGSALLGIISPNTVLLYRDGMDIDQQTIGTTLRLPKSWHAATALATLPNDESADVIEYAPVSLRTFVDSPIMCGKYSTKYELVDDKLAGTIPPHRLHIFSEAESVLDIHPELLEKLQQMVVQSAQLFDSHPFDQFDILLATTDVLPANGLEHSYSSLNVLHQRSLQSPGDLRGWNRLLIPHEYIHAWCGKYRTPESMVATDFHTPLSTEMLWVYEGLTQYLGELIEARSGLMTPDEFRHRLALEVRHATHQQGRKWRSLADTGAASSVLRDSSPSWPRLRRSQDYYMEGMLLWLEIDARLREQSGEKVSLDDFCREFFHTDGPATQPRPFTFHEVVETLNKLVPYDWNGLLTRRVLSTDATFNTEFLHPLGYMIQYSNQRPDIPNDTYRAFPEIDAYDSLGLGVGNDGTVRDVLLDSPADRAGLGPGMKITAINGHTWSPNRLLDAIALSPTLQKIDLAVTVGDSLQSFQLDYAGGPRYQVMLKKPGSRDRLEEIVKQVNDSTQRSQ